jgi:hypothetical protein
MGINPKDLAKKLRSAAQSYYSENGEYETLPQFVIAVRDSEDPRDFILVEFPKNVGQTFFPKPASSGGSSTSSHLFPCPHCGKDIKYSK